MNRENLPLNITEKSRSRMSLLCAAAVMLLLAFLIHQIDYSLIQKPKVQAQRAEEKAKKEAEEAAAQKIVTTASIVAVGNNILDTTLYQSGQNMDGTWTYDHLYTNVKEEIQAADLALVSQTTVLTEDHTAVSGAPSYLSPAEITDALADAGFDIVAGASCHGDDYGSSAITQTIESWKNRHSSMTLLGLHDTSQSASTIQVLNVNDIRIAFLNYTYGTRNNLLTAEESYMIDTFDKEQITSAIEAAKEQSDCIIFVAHWGDESSFEPNEFQKQWASYLMSLGVNVIIGNHPMTVQPYGTMSDENGNETTVFYSLGNFLSIQETPEATLGGMAKFTVEKTVQGRNTSIRIIDKSLEPLVNHYSYETANYGPYFLKDYTDALASENSINASLYGQTYTVAGLQQTFDQVMSVTVTPSTATDQVDAASSVTGAQPSGNGTAPNGEAVTYDAYGGYYDADGNYYDVSGNIFTMEGYYDPNGNFYSY